MTKGQFGLSVLGLIGIFLLGRWLGKPKRDRTLAEMLGKEKDNAAFCDMSSEEAVTEICRMLPLLIRPNLTKVEAERVIADLDDTIGALGIGFEMEKESALSVDRQVSEILK